MVTITELNKKYALIKAKKTLTGLSDRKVEEAISRMERSSDGIDRITAIAMRAETLGGDENAFKKALKVYTKTTKEHVRIA